MECIFNKATIYTLSHSITTYSIGLHYIIFYGTLYISHYICSIIYPVLQILYLSVFF